MHSLCPVVVTRWLVGGTYKNCWICRSPVVRALRKDGVSFSFWAYSEEFIDYTIKYFFFLFLISMNIFPGRRNGSIVIQFIEMNNSEKIELIWFLTNVTTIKCIRNYVLYTTNLPLTRETQFGLQTRIHQTPSSKTALVWKWLK